MSAHRRPRRRALDAADGIAATAAFFAAYVLTGVLLALVVAR